MDPSATNRDCAANINPTKFSTLPTAKIENPERGSEQNSATTPCGGGILTGDPPIALVNTRAHFKVFDSLVAVADEVAPEVDEDGPDHVYNSAKPPQVHILVLCGDVFCKQSSREHNGHHGPPETCPFPFCGIPYGGQELHNKAIREAMARFPENIISEQ